MSDHDPKEPRDPQGTGDDAAEPDGPRSTADAEAAEKAEAEAAARAKAEAAEKAKAAAEARAAAEAAKPPWERDPATPEWEEADGDPLAQAARQRFAGAVLSARTYAGELTLELAAETVAEVGRWLRDEQGFTYLVDACGADYPDREKRFDVVYHVYNFEGNRRIRLKVATDEATPVPTVSDVWTVANWFEREAYDMFGIRFADHPDPTRILLWEGFNGHPLRKDFPVEGLDTGSAIYPEYYEAEAGPVAGTGTGWKAPTPPEAAAEEGGDEPPADRA